MNMKFLAFALMGSAFSAALAEEAAPELVTEESGNGRWTVRAGYAWRSQADTDFSAGNSLPPGGTYLNGSISGSANLTQDWTFDGTFDEGRYVDPNYGNTPLYSMALERRESIGGGSDDDSASGFNLSIAYDVWQGTYVDVSIATMFAGYWNMQNSCSGGYRQYYDHYSFGYPTPETVSFSGLPQEGVDSAEYRDRSYGFGGANPSMHLETDLYQIGLGPQFTVRPFEGWCESLSWLDVYGNVQVLCNIVHSDFTAGAASTSDTDCLLGFGGNFGLVGNVTDWCGIFGQIGYEWIDEDEISTHGCRAETDYSSLVLSAGVQFRF